MQKSRTALPIVETPRTMQTKSCQPLASRKSSVCQVIHNYKGEEALRYDHIAVDNMRVLTPAAYRRTTLS